MSSTVVGKSGAFNKLLVFDELFINDLNVKESVEKNQESIQKNQESIEKNQKDIEENTTQLANSFRPVHPPLVGPFKEISTGEILTYDDLYQWGDPILFTLMGSPLDLPFGTNTRKVTVNTGLVQYYKGNELKTFNGTENMKTEDFYDFWLAFVIWVKFNVTNVTPGSEVYNSKIFDTVDQFIMWSSSLGRNFEHVKAFSNITNGIRGFLENQNQQDGFAFLPLPYSSYELTFTTKHYDKMPATKALNRPFDSGLVFDIQNLDSIPTNGLKYDDINMQGYQFFNPQHPSGKGIIVKYPYGNPDFSWFTPTSPEVLEQLEKINPTDTYVTKLVRQNNIINIYVIHDGITIHVHKDFKSQYAGGFVGFQYEACQVDYTDIELSPVST